MNINEKKESVKQVREKFETSQAFFITHNLGLKAEMEILIVCDENDNVNEKEKLFIKLFKDKGIDLLNMTEGGDGLQNPSEEVRRKIGEKSKGRIPSKETRDKISLETQNMNFEEIKKYFEQRRLKLTK